MSASLFQIAGYVLLAGALVLAGWALLWDRARGRRRCPRCWYDMNGTGGLCCPECGMAARSERGLYRTRRRWRMAPVVLILLLAALAACAGPTVRRRGLVRSLPCSVLVLLPFDPGVISGDSANPRRWELAVWEEIDDRAQEWALAGWQIRYLAWRFDSRLVAGDSRCRIAYPVEDLAPMVWGYGRDIDCNWAWDGVWRPSDAWSRDLENLVVGLGWLGDASATLSVKGAQGYLFVCAPPSTHSSLAELLEQMRRSRVIQDVAVYEPMLRTLRTTPIQLAKQWVTLAELARAIEQRTGTPVRLADDLVDCGAAPEAAVCIGLGLPSAADLLDMLATGQAWPDWRIAWELDIGGVTITTDRQRHCTLAVYSLADLLAPRESEVAGREVSMRALEQNSLREWDSWEVADLVLCMCSMDSWFDNGGEIGRHWLYGDHLIINTTLKRHIEIAAFLQRLRVLAAAAP